MRSEIRTVKTRAEFLQAGDIVQVPHPNLRGRKMWLEVSDVVMPEEGMYRVLAAGLHYTYRTYDVITCQVVK